MENKEIIENLFKKTTRSNNIHDAVLFVENSKGDFSVNCGYGGKDINSPIFMASVAKLFVTSCILILEEQKKLSLDDLAGKYIDETILNGLHIYKGNEYSHKLTISDLLFQTSGLAEGLGFFIKSATEDDIEVTFEAVIEKTKTLRPHFIPNTTGKAYYSDTNFRLLVCIIENITEKPISKAFLDYICNPLDMVNTYLPTKDDDIIPTVYYKT